MKHTAISRMIPHLILILGILALLDYLYYRVPNLIVLPGIAYGIYLTGNWHAALVMFCLGAFLYKKEFWRGGDVKLMALLGAWLGVKAIFILPFTLVLIYLYRIRFSYHKALPVTPFTFFAALPFIFLQP